MARNDWDQYPELAKIPGEIEPSRSSPDIREYGLMFFLRWCAVLMTIGTIAFAYVALTDTATGADLVLPVEITEGRSRGPTMNLNRFGHYSMNYYRKRWVSLCKGGGRYVAMAEAYDMRQPNPCL